MLVTKLNLLHYYVMSIRYKLSSQKQKPNKQAARLAFVPCEPSTMQATSFTSQLQVSLQNEKGTGGLKAFGLHEVAGCRLYTSFKTRRNSAHSRQPFAIHYILHQNVWMLWKWTHTDALVMGVGKLTFLCLPMMFPLLPITTAVFHNTSPCTSSLSNIGETITMSHFLAFAWQKTMLSPPSTGSANWHQRFSRVQKANGMLQAS